MVSATDRWGQSVNSNPFVIAIRAVNLLPYITSDPPLNAIGGMEYQYQVRAVDGNNDTLIYALASSPENMTINSSTGFVNWTPSKWGKFKVSICASDGILTAYQNFTITVDDRAPRVIAGTPPDALVWQAYEYRIPAVDDDGDVLSFDLLSPIPGMTVDSTTGVLAWTPSSVGSLEVSVRISDWMKTIVYNFTITVVQGNRPPHFTSTPGLDAVVGLHYYYNATATDPDNNALQYNLISEPAMMNLDNLTGRIVWVPIVAGTFSVVLKVYDGRGGETFQSFNITVVNKELPRIIITNILEGQKISGRSEVKGTVVKGTLEISIVQIKIDGGYWENASSIQNWSYDIDTTHMSNGRHSFEVRAYDGIDYSNITKIDFVVDNQSGNNSSISEMIPVGIGIVALVTALVGIIIWMRKHKR